MKTGKEKEEVRERKERNEKEQKKGISEEEKEKKDRMLKASLDPMNDIKKALAVKEPKHHQSKKMRKSDTKDKRSSGGR